MLYEKEEWRCIVGVSLVGLARWGPLLSAPHSGAKPSAPVRPVSMNWERRRKRRGERVRVERFEEGRLLTKKSKDHNLLNADKG